MATHHAFLFHSMNRNTRLLLFLGCTVLMSFIYLKKRPATIYLVGDSTVADYTLEQDYKDKRYPLAGWGQVFQSFFVKDSLNLIKGIISTDSVRIDDRAKGGRSTRTFFEEGRWAEVYKLLKQGDLVIIQFGHNDAAKEKTERYVTLSGYKEYLRLFVNQARQKGALPILVTPVSRNYPWKDGKLSSAHGDYPQAMKEVSIEQGVPLIDLTQLSVDYFTSKGQDYVASHYFMNLPKGTYTAYPDGQSDNTHFQPEGAKAVAQLVFNGLKNISAAK